MDVLTYVGKNEKHAKDVFCKISGKVTSVGGRDVFKGQMECCSSGRFYRRRFSRNVFAVRLLLRYDLKRVVRHAFHVIAPKIMWRY